MKDFYRRMMVMPDEFSADAIARAVDAGWIDDTTAHEAAYVLLSQERRPVYDRTHRALTAIGQLRANLGLTNSPGHLLTKLQDFNPPPAPIRSDWQHTEPSWLLQNWKMATAWGTALTAAMVILYSAVGGRNNSDFTRRSNSNPIGLTDQESRNAATAAPMPSVLASPTPPEVAFDAPEVRFPGTTFHLEVPEANAIAPIRLTTGLRNIGTNFFVKVVDVRNKQVVLKMFIQGGRIIDAEMPFGTYEVRYAVGEKWYGEKHCFGPETRYYRADETFTFRQVGDEVQGYTIELYERIGGNLRTDEMTADDF